jgi:hypothetical protein
MDSPRNRKFIGQPQCPGAPRKSSNLESPRGRTLIGERQCPGAPERPTTSPFHPENNRFQIAAIIASHCTTGDVDADLNLATVLWHRLALDHSGTEREFCEKLKQEFLDGVYHRRF